MKIAISLSGQPYTNDECVSSFNLNLFSNFSDVFSHFWWDEAYLNKCFKMHYNMKIEDKNIIKNIVKNFNIFACKTEPHVKEDFSYFESINMNTWNGMSLEYHRMMVPILLYGVRSQIESINNSIKLIDKAKYDVIIRTRPDLVYLNDINIIIKNLNFSSKSIFIQTSGPGGHLYAGEPPGEPCDWFYMGNVEAMSIFTESLKKYFIQEFKCGPIHLRDFIKYVAIHSGVKLELIDFGALIYKQTSNFDFNFKNNIDIYINDFDTKSCCPKNFDIWPYWINNVDFKHFNNMNFL